jgi:pimeloyl-ACP methyl ester carboxylesterase
MKTSSLRISSTFDLHYDADAASDLPALLLLHGMTGEGKDWRHVFDLELLSKSYRLIIPDLRGHGRSELPAEAFPFTHRQCAEDVRSLLDHLGVKTTTFAIGLSLGGNTLLHLATTAVDHPARVEAMVLVASTPYFPESARAIMRSSTSDNALHTKQFRGFAEDVDDLSFTPARLARIQARTLLVNGDRDPLYPVSMLFGMRDAIPRSSLWVIPEGGHGPIFGEQRDAFARTAIRFLKGEALA